MSPENEGRFEPTEDAIKKLFEGHRWADEGASPSEAIRGDEDSPHVQLVKAIKRQMRGYNVTEQLAAMASVLLEMTDYHPDPNALDGGPVIAQGAWQFGQNQLYQFYTPPKHILFVVAYLCWLRKYLVQASR